jgi:predicted amidohydrolase YtcJ
VILENGLIRTLDRRVRTVRALAIAGAWIAGGVGVHETALPTPERVDLDGRVVLPGLNDAGVRAGADLDGLRAALRHAAARGVSAVHAEDGLPLWAELEARGALTLRVSARLSAEQLEAVRRLGLRPGFGSAFLRLGIAGSAAGSVYASGRILADVDPLAAIASAADVEEAFASMTANVAALAGEGRRRGKLLPGYAADVVVLDRDPWDDPHAEVVATMVAGRWVHNPPPW